MAYKNPIELANSFDELSPENERNIRKQLSNLYFQMQPYLSQRNQEIVRKIYAGDKSDTPYPEEYNALSTQHTNLRKQLADILNKRYDRLAQQLGRKRYENFNSNPNSVPINPNNPGGSPDVIGPDRLYALYQHALTDDLDFSSVLSNDRGYFPDRTPNTLEFSNDKFVLKPGSSGGDHWKKIKEGENPDPNFGEIKDGWRHISTGTNYGNDIFRLLEKENLV